MSNRISLIYSKLVLKPLLLCFFQSSRSFLSQQYLVTVNGYAYLGCKYFNWRSIQYSSPDTLAGYLNKDVLHATVNYGNIHYSENSDRKWGSEIFNSWEWMKKKNSEQDIMEMTVMWKSGKGVSINSERGQEGHSTLDKKEKHTVIECKKEDSWRSDGKWELHATEGRRRRNEFVKRSHWPQDCPERSDGIN